MAYNFYQLDYYKKLYEIKNQITQIEYAKGNSSFMSFSQTGRAGRYAYNFTKQKSDAQWYAREQGEVKLLYDAYETIQSMRQQITGQEIKYRLYARTSKNQDARIGYIEVNGAELSKFLTAESTALRINESAVRKQINLKEREIKIRKATQATYSRVDRNYLKSTEVINGIYKGLIDQKILNQQSISYNYTKRDGQLGIGTMKSLVYTPTNTTTNQGVVLENIDKMIFNADGKLRRIGNMDNFISQSISKFVLDKDSISGFKQGDNGLYQIKANKAQLMEYSTIMRTIDDVLSIGMHITENQYDIAREELLNIFSGEGQMSISQKKARSAIAEMARNDILSSFSDSSGSRDSRDFDVNKDWM